MNFSDPSFWSRLQFGFTVVYHYLFPQLTMGLAWFLVYFKFRALRTGDGQAKLVGKHQPVTLAATEGRYAANPLGASFLDAGVGGLLEGPANPNRGWTPIAKSFIGRYKTPTLRNVDKRPGASFVKAYMHNGYLKSLKEVVHFYNTRDALPRCRPGDPGEKVSCWPAPEHTENMNRRQLGDLGRSIGAAGVLMQCLWHRVDVPRRGCEGSFRGCRLYAGPVLRGYFQ